MTSRERDLTFRLFERRIWAWICLIWERDLQEERANCSVLVVGGRRCTGWTGGLGRADIGDSQEKWRTGNVVGKLLE